MFMASFLLCHKRCTKSDAVSLQYQPNRTRNRAQIENPLIGDNCLFHNFWVFRLTRNVPELQRLLSSSSCTHQIESSPKFPHLCTMCGVRVKFSLFQTCAAWRHPQCAFIWHPQRQCQTFCSSFVGTGIGRSHWKMITFRWRCTYCVLARYVERTRRELLVTKSTVHIRDRVCCTSSESLSRLQISISCDRYVSAWVKLPTPLSPSPIPLSLYLCKHKRMVFSRRFCSCRWISHFLLWSCRHSWPSVASAFYFLSQSPMPASLRIAGASLRRGNASLTCSK